MNDFVIGFYSFCAFIIPLRKFIKIEETESKDSTITDIAKRVTIYSSIAILSTIMIIITTFIFTETATLLYTLDSVINTFCVIQQFSSDGHSLSNKFCKYIYCICNEAEKNLVENIEMNHTIDINKCAPSTENK